MITREWPLVAIYATGTAFLAFETRLLGGADGGLWTTVVLVWLFATVLAIGFITDRTIVLGLDATSCSAPCTSCSSARIS